MTIAGMANRILTFPRINGPPFISWDEFRRFMACFIFSLAVGLGIGKCSYDSPSPAPETKGMVTVDENVILPSNGDNKK